MIKPNILFLMTDQQRWDAMGCSGDWLNTKYLDRIANEGVRFSNCITTTPICIPARVTLQSGLYATTRMFGTTSTSLFRPMLRVGCV